MSTRIPGRSAEPPLLRLRPVQDADLEALYEHQRDPMACELAAFPSRGREAFFRHWTQLLATASIRPRAIVVEGQVVGSLVCFGPAEERQVGYWLAREVWGRGWATLALRTFLQEHMERPLHAFVAVHNQPSIRVLEKCGFRCIGRERGPDEVEELHYLLSEQEGDGRPATAR